MASSINASTSGAGGIITTADNTGILNLQTASTTAVTVDASQKVTTVGNTSLANSSGNVGIGGASIDAGEGKLNIASSTSPSSLHLFYGANGDNYYTCGTSGIQVFRTGSTERMRIDSSGNTLFGTTNSSQTAGVGTKINYDAAGNNVNCVTSATTNGGSSTYVYYSSGAAAYRFYVGAGGTVFATSTTISAISDQRLKENVKDLDVGLNEIMQLKPRTFDWKEGKGKDIKGDRGFIAQEFEQIFPDLIDEWKDEPPEGEDPYKSVRQDLIPVLVKAIQEQQTIINDLKARVTALEGTA
jgi:hypothetical protein